jgi:hypothetical protein
MRTSQRENAARAENIESFLKSHVKTIKRDHLCDNFHQQNANVYHTHPEDYYPVEEYRFKVI